MIAWQPFAYGQARLHARIAGLADDSEWRRLAAVRTLGGYLEEARMGALGPWVKGFSGVSDAHALEQGLRALAWDSVAEVSAWVPNRWRAAVRWLGWLPYLPMLEHLARGEPLPHWVCEDYRLRGLVGEEEGCADAAVLGGLLGRALAAGAGGERVAAAWASEWHRRLPLLGREQARQLHGLVRTLRAHLVAFRTASPGEAPALRQGLRGRLRLRLRLEPLGPSPFFVYLALVLLDLEQLRGELVLRSLDPLGQHEASP